MRKRRGRRWDRGRKDTTPSLCPGFWLQLQRSKTGLARASVRHRAMLALQPRMVKRFMTQSIRFACCVDQNLIEWIMNKWKTVETYPWLLFSNISWLYRRLFGVWYHREHGLGQEQWFSNLFNLMAHAVVKLTIISSDLLCLERHKTGFQGILSLEAYIETYMGWKIAFEGQNGNVTFFLHHFWTKSKAHAENKKPNGNWVPVIKGSASNNEWFQPLDFAKKWLITQSVQYDTHEHITFIFYWVMHKDNCSHCKLQATFSDSCLMGPILECFIQC